MYRKLFSAFQIVSLFGLIAAVNGKLEIVGSSVLGRDPQTVNRLNGESFQQDALATFNGVYQIIAFLICH